MSRIIIYGDIHGCLEEFKNLRKKIDFNENDKEIVIGDILDKGPYSVETLRFCIENKIESILGNHEYKYLRYKKHYELFVKTNKKIPMKLDDEKSKIFESLNNEDFEYLLNMNFYKKIDNLTLIHAGITNDIKLDENNQHDLEKLLWIRKLDDNQKPVALRDSNLNYKWWSEYYNGNQGFIIYGHQPFDKIKIDEYSIGIDTGCVHGNKLTALIINDTINPKDNYYLVQIEGNKYA
ncbi:metallophosphoesterase family protein [Halarcobacter sp.]|uniref:metallophosphoesterase family protein n=1 Tax=Halarcobacter sp. TaxID=2321133 RepID=UPI0029F50BFE|nr:metallophosphoesterase family protein [Halarcobacter sp.]